MKKMQHEDGQIVRVYAHLITKNMWEYYILDNARGDIRLALVLGDFTEMGDVSISELRPYLRSNSAVTPDTDLMPAPGWHWVD